MAGDIYLHSLGGDSRGIMQYLFSLFFLSPVDFNTNYLVLFSAVYVRSRADSLLRSQ